MQCGVHATVQAGELSRVLAEQIGSELGDARACPSGVGRQIKRSERTNLAVPRHSVVSFDRDDRAVKNRD